MNKALNTELWSDLTVEELETRTEYGFWNPLVWVMVFVFALIFAYIVRLLGEKEYKKDSEQTKTFFAGQTVGKHMFSDIYWGFFAGIKKYYKWVKKFHTGVVNDYVYWFTFILMVILILLSAGG